MSAADEAEKYIPRNTCALIKAFMGFKLAGLCPYVQTTDLIVGETTCDGKKKAYELFDEMTNGKMYVMEIPNKKGEDGKSLWKNEVKRFSEKLESLSGKKITLEKLKEASKIVNDKRKALQRLSLLRANDPSPISGLDALLVNQVAFYDDPLRFTAKVNELCDELDQRVKSRRRSSLQRESQDSRFRFAYGDSQLETSCHHRRQRRNDCRRGIMCRREKFQVIA